jgi:lysophospholipase L1-like esterase
MPSSSAKRLARLLACAALLVGSLVTFPAGIPWMIACWLVWYPIILWRGGPGWLPLAGCFAVLAVKRIDWPAGMWALAGATFVVGLLGRTVNRFDTTRRRKFICVLAAFLGLAWLDMAWDWHRGAHANHSPPPLDQRPVVCLGDSLTSYPPRGDFPAVLARLVTVPVVNLGRPGITSHEALALLPEVVKAKPQVVVIELGGHDFLKDPSYLKTESRAATKRNLERIVAAVRELDAEVLLFEIPRGFITDPYAGVEREIARQNDLELVADTAVRKLVLESPAGPIGVWTGGPFLSDDGLHPNARGDAFLAHCVAQALANLYGREVLR